jgi:tetratricopeptide (TPR) repeat protein
MRTEREYRQSQGKVYEAKQKLKIVAELTLAIGLLIPTAWAQKPPAPAPAPPPTPTPSPPIAGPNSPMNPVNPNLRPGEDRVVFVLGQVKTSDGSAVPNDTMVERICNERVRQQVFAGSQGSFSMQLGSRTEAVIDASADSDAQDMTASDYPTGGISRHELEYCELRVTVAGFRPTVVRLLDLTVSAGTVNVGVMMVDRSTKVGGNALSATPYRAPKEARKAYEKGVAAANSGKLAQAQKDYEKAVELYPKYISAWYELGVVLQKEKDKDGARAAYKRACAIDTKFLPPYLSLAMMAYSERNWMEVLEFTGHILDLDPLGHTKVTGYVVDLDPLNSAEAYFYNAFANYELGRMDEAEKSAVKAEHVDLATHYPQLHLLLAEIYAQKNNFGAAIDEVETYLALVPRGKDVDQVREQLAKLEKLNGGVPTSGKAQER